MKKLVVAVALALVAGSSPATPLVGRSATVNKPFQVFAWANLGYNQTAKTYNWLAGEWDATAMPLKTTSCDLTAAIGLPGKLDIDVVVPLGMREDTLTNNGIGDLMVYARYGLLQSSVLPIKAAVILGANLPTADITQPASLRLGDRTTDIGIAASVNTQKYFGLVGHARAGYWLNGKVNDTTKVGNMLEYIVVADYSLTKTLTPELAVSGFSRAQTEYNGTAKPNTEISQHTASLLLMWKPISILVVRPKVAFPLTFMSKGGSVANWYAGLDVWTLFP